MASPWRVDDALGVKVPAAVGLCLSVAVSALRLARSSDRDCADIVLKVPRDRNLGDEVVIVGNNELIFDARLEEVVEA